MSVKDLIKAANALDVTNSPAAKLAADAIDYVLNKVAEEDDLRLSKEMLNAEQTGMHTLIRAEEEIRQLQQTTDPALKRIFEMAPEILSHLGKAAEELGSAYQKHYELTEGGTGMPTRMLEKVSPEEWGEGETPDYMKVDMSSFKNTESTAYHELAKAAAQSSGEFWRDIQAATDALRNVGDHPSDEAEEIFSADPSIVTALTAALERLYEVADQLSAQSGSPLENLIQGQSAGPVDPETTASAIYNELTKAADFLDSEGHAEAANILDSLLKDAAPVFVPDYPDRSETRDMYDAEANNKESLRGRLVEQVLMNDESHLEAHRGKAKSLSSRYDPDMPGVTMIRVSDGVYQSPVTRKVYDYNTGWQGDGESYPGGSVKHQTPSFSQYSNPTRLFENRNQRMRRR